MDIANYLNLFVFVVFARGLSAGVHLQLPLCYGNVLAMF
ncbi:hypothetical protein JCM19237_3140 [Photobacterium aphoticum]|uniref:Uncharacterized protein n=1 Tax=Photobacterium aphoticum TaxID=754436 RepID=A0A090R0E2_9GAMM|nr:hypothetical protein JCM19237_3140 [Photobacterium aphoticum]